MDSWDSFKVYEEVTDEGQPRLGTNWVVTEKVINEEEAVFVTIIPRYLHCEKRCKDAKQK